MNTTTSRMQLDHRTLLILVGGFAAAALAAAVWLYVPPPDVQAAVQGEDWVDARVEEVSVVGPAAPFFDPDSDEVDVRVTATLADTGEQVTFVTYADIEGAYRPGQRVLLAPSPGGEEPDRAYSIVDVRRERPVAALVALFAVAVVALGRWQGLRALIGLVITFGVIVAFLVPSILGGESPVAVALVAAGLILLATMYLSHGFNAKTTVAIVGTAVALIVTAVLAVGFTWATSITGVMDEDVRLLSALIGGIDVRGLLLAGIIIGGLGVLDDVTMTQSATVFQVHRAAAAPTFSQLFRAGMSVGRDHVAAAVNTLFLAYAGAALPLLLLFATHPAQLGRVLSLEVVTVEIVRTFVGSIGLISAVPVTTALAAALAGREGDVDTADEVVPHVH
jgi:uncharacterized membrane protein